MIIEKYRQADFYVTGKDHLSRKIECQDRTFYYKENGVHVLTLSDGAGSRSKSQFGAEIVTEYAAKYVAKNFIDLLILSEKRGKDQQLVDRDLLKIKTDFLTYLTEMLNAFCLKTEGVQINDLACTLELYAFKDNKYFAIHIGDGVIGLLKSDITGETLKVLSHPENGGAPNITFFITDNNAIEHLRVYSGEMNNIKGIILMSDGPEEALYQKDNGLSSNVKILFDGFSGNTQQDYCNFLEKLLTDKIAQISYDDLSINLIYKDSFDTNSDYKKEYLNELLDGIADNQILPQSDYCVLIDDAIESDGKVKDEATRLKDLQRKYDR